MISFLYVTVLGVSYIIYIDFYLSSSMIYDNKLPQNSKHKRIFIL